MSDFIEYFYGFVGIVLMFAFAVLFPFGKKTKPKPEKKSEGWLSESKKREIDSVISFYERIMSILESQEIAFLKLQAEVNKLKAEQKPKKRPSSRIR